ncbi:hypothetical protein V2647_03630 [Tenacibaculum maritimum]|uniref:hypothetical protein n=1 Tax=Tenacibaculum maritimum TaxID=107401 RepID=UPI0012E4E1C3|nr:hypothetical protein [Tenacibaculum maritimum]CAA0149765.1 hypothetical protein TMP227_10116 [Tenacibaculum maritimum]
MIKIVRKTSVPQYQDVNDLGLHPNTVILCNGFGVNPITKALHMKFVQVHDEQNPQAVIAVLPELRFTEASIYEELNDNGQIVSVGYPTKDSVKDYLNFEFDSSDVTLPEDPALATKAAIWLLLNDNWKHLNLKEEWAVEYNGSLIEVADNMLA